MCESDWILCSSVPSMPVQCQLDLMCEDDLTLCEGDLILLPHPTPAVPVGLLSLLCQLDLVCEDDLTLCEGALTLCVKVIQFCVLLSPACWFNVGWTWWQTERPETATDKRPRSYVRKWRRAKLRETPCSRSTARFRTFRSWP